MAVQTTIYHDLLKELENTAVTLVAVTKTKPIEDIQELYALGHRDFGENYVQEIQEKYPVLPNDIRWHFIGHVQSNKVKYIAPYVFMIHGVDSFKLLQEINKQAVRNNRVIHCLLQIHIAEEETKFGLNEEELFELLYNFNNGDLKNVMICGLMAMASFTDDFSIVRREFKSVKVMFDKAKEMYFKRIDDFSSISMGMSNDYKIAIEEGSTIIRIGSKLFGSRN
ncbi:MAG: YggS family pyridoxal phosphate-dependent enzyme [Chitinophagaceae bacterium]|nr:YggS family pyridoxal phosphate-dependent enzyme [Chitinophagaceae bacterium]